MDEMRIETAISTSIGGLRDTDDFEGAEQERERMADRERRHNGGDPTNAASGCAGSAPPPVLRQHGRDQHQGEQEQDMIGTVGDMVQSEPKDPLEPTPSATARTVNSDVRPAIGQRAHQLGRAGADAITPIRSHGKQHIVRHQLAGDNVVVEPEAIRRAARWRVHPQMGDERVDPRRGRFRPSRASSCSRHGRQPRHWRRDGRVCSVRSGAVRRRSSRRGSGAGAPVPS